MTNVMINKMINIINYIMTDIMMIHFNGKIKYECWILTCHV